MKNIIIPTKNELDDYLEFSCDFIFPLYNYSVDYKKTYTLDEVINFKKQYNNINVYVIINKPIFNSDIDDIRNLLCELDSLKISGILFYDLAILELYKENNLHIPLIWNNTHMVVNYKTCDYYKDKGCSVCLLSNEITIDEILEISNKSKIKLWMMVVGYPIMAFSRRKLLTNHAKYHKLKNKNDLKVREHSTQINYDIFENSFGTSFRKEEIMNASKIIKYLDLDGILFKEEDIDHNIFIKVLSLYKNYFDKKIDEEEFISCGASLIGNDTNFLFSKTYYQVKCDE